MFLDSGNIISDETFYTQSQIMVEKVPEFSAESLCHRQGMVTSGNFFHHYLTLCVECFVRKYIADVCRFVIALCNEL